MTSMHSERPSYRNGCRLMQKTAAQYRKFAEECDQLAQLERSDRHRSILKEMADAWRQLAAQADSGA